MPSRPLILASASPARLGLLRAAGLVPEVIVSGVPEDDVDGMPAHEAVRALADRKAGAVAERLAGGEVVAGTGAGAVGTGTGGTAGMGAGGIEGAAALVLGCDSMLLFGGEVRGKPTSADQARHWWRSVRNQKGTLLTGHVLVDMGSQRRAAGVSETTVHFGAPGDDEIEAYVASGEPLRVAGGFTLDGRSAPFVDAIEGDHGTVLGLSLPLLRRLLTDLGVPIVELWA